MECWKFMFIETPEITKTIARAKEVLQIESKAISNLVDKIDESFAQTCQALLSCQGRVILTGIGKSGHIGHKIAATLSSTGTPAFFLHPSEACHGDLGLVTEKDVILALSYSGNTEELSFMLPWAKRLGVLLISMTGNHDSIMAKIADIHLHVPIEKEACSLGVAPTASTTAMLALGDAIAIATLEARGFTLEDFGRSHPGGQLGKRLILTVDDIMHSGKHLPLSFPQEKVAYALIEMTNKRLGTTLIVEENNPTKLLGIFTDGDLRRALEKKIDIHKTPIEEVMMTHFSTVPTQTLASQALRLMETNSFNALPIVDKNNRLIGVLNMHDLLKAKII